MIINRTYEEARLEAIHILSAYENYPTTITIKPIEHNGKIQWGLDYEEEHTERILKND